MSINGTVHGFQIYRFHTEVIRMRFICPICGQAMEDNNKTLFCINRHSFDKAKSGYVNLFLSSGTGNHGDSAEMIKARRSFLEAGYYLPLAELLYSVIADYVPKKSVIVDAGCGEGYYSVLKA